MRIFHTILFFSLTCLIFFVFCADAEESDTDSPADQIAQGAGLSDLLKHAYENSPAIKAAREEWRESIEQYRVNTAYPDPQITVTYWPKSFADNLDAQKVETMLAQGIPFPGKLAAAGRGSRAEADYRRIALDRAVRDVVVNIRESCHELLYIREARRIALQNQELLSAMKTLGQTAYAENRGQLIDVMKAQSQTAQSGYDILLLEELEKTEAARMNSLLNREPESPIGTLTAEPFRPLVYQLEEIFCLAEKNREEIRMAAAEIRKSEAGADMARLENRPDFMFGIIYESDAAKEPEGSRESMSGFQFGMSLPLWWNKNSGRTGAAKAALEKAKAMSAAQVNETQAMVRENYFRLKNAQRLVVLYRDQLIPQASKSVETAQTWYDQKQGSFSDYLETQSVWYNFQLALARATADYGKYLARLEGLAGQSLTVREQESGCPQKDAP